MAASGVTSTDSFYIPCSICNNNIEPNQARIITTCSHIFHNNCLLEFLGNQNRCPICSIENPLEDSLENGNIKKAGKREIKSVSSLERKKKKYASIGGIICAISTLAAIFIYELNVSTKEFAENFIPCFMGTIVISLLGCGAGYVIPNIINCCSKSSDEKTKALLPV